MADDFKNPLKQLLLDKMIDKGFFNAKDIDRSTIQTISDLEDSDILKLLKDFGVGPTIAKKEGGIVHMEKGGDALLGKLVENLKNKPKLASATETMLDQIAALDEPKDVVVERPTVKTSNVLKGSKVMRKMGPEVIEVFDKAGITKAQIAEIQKVPNINDYLDDFDGFNKAMKKYRTTALKGLDKDQLAAIQKTGYLSGYKTNIMEDIMKKGASYNPKSKKYTIKPKYKNVLTLNKKGEPAISMAFQNKYLDENFDYVYDERWFSPVDRTLRRELKSRFGAGGYWFNTTNYKELIDLRIQYQNISNLKKLFIKLQKDLNIFRIKKREDLK